MLNVATRVCEVLHHSASCKVLPAEALEGLIARGCVVKYAKGDVIYRRGDHGDSLMVVLSGTVKITNVSANGKEIVLGFVREGMVNGEMAVLDGKERTANAIALEATEAFQIYRRDLLPVLRDNPDVVFHLLQLVCGNLRQTNALVEGYTLQMNARLAQGLLRLAARHGRKVNGGTRIDLKISHRDLGGHVGLTRESVSRLLREFRDERLIESEKGVIVILDPENLRLIADGAED